MIEKTLIILNPHAGSGKAGRLWTQIEPLLWKELGELVIAVTQHPEEVAAHLDKARAVGLTRVIAIGGDGTNHTIINELMRLNAEDATAPRMTFGCLPIGTGHDWARTLGIPLRPADAVRWIAGAHPTPLDVGALRFTTHGQTVSRNFLNIASGGIGGDVVKRVNRQAQRYPWTFLSLSVASLLRYRPTAMRVSLDGNPWYEGGAYIVAVANGRSFGHGMQIAPQAQIADGLFDVVLVEAMPRARILSALGTVYNGTHIKRTDVHTGRARVVEIEAPDALEMELDGEAAEGSTIRFELRPRALNVLTHSPL